MLLLLLVMCPHEYLRLNDKMEHTNVSRCDGWLVTNTCRRSRSSVDRQSRKLITKRVLSVF